MASKRQLKKNYRRSRFNKQEFKKLSSADKAKIAKIDSEYKALATKANQLIKEASITNSPYYRDVTKYFKYDFQGHLKDEWFSLESSMSVKGANARLQKLEKFFSTESRFRDIQGYNEAMERKRENFKHQTEADDLTESEWDILLEFEANYTSRYNRHMEYKEMANVVDVYKITKREKEISAQQFVGELKEYLKEEHGSLSVSIYKMRKPVRSDSKGFNKYFPTF